MPPDSGRFVSRRAESGVAVPFGKVTGANAASHRSGKEESDNEWNTWSRALSATGGRCRSRSKRMSLAFVFPGQGAQTVGMGRDLATACPAARAVFEEVDEALGEKLSALVWEGDAEVLKLTENAQPALMATSMAVVRALEAEGVDVTAADYVAGHSLGEYSALCAAGAITLTDAARLLKLRGKAMQAAVPVGDGAMAAVLGLDCDAVEEVAARAAQGGVCQVANENDPMQNVISGSKEAVERAVEHAKEAGAKRAVMLPVSAPFHCSLMTPAAATMAQALGDVEIARPRVPVVANVLAADAAEPSVIRSLLVDQVAGRVRWRASVEWMAGHGVTEFWELGAGKALSGMIRRTAREAGTRAVGTAREVAEAAASR